MAEGHGLHVEFFIESVLQSFKSEEAGRPVHEDREFVRIHIPGSRDFTEREAHAGDKQKFAVEYAHFKNGLKEEQQASGTPLKVWPAMTRSMAKDFAAINVYTVEQLAGLSDTAIQHFGMGGRDWSVKAQAYLKAAEDSAYAPKLAAENDELKRRISDLERQFAELAPEKRGPGRPRKPDNPVHELTEAL